MTMSESASKLLMARLITFTFAIDKPLGRVTQLMSHDSSLLLHRKSTLVFKCLFCTCMVKKSSDTASDSRQFEASVHNRLILRMVICVIVFSFISKHGTIRREF